MSTLGDIATVATTIGEAGSFIMGLVARYIDGESSEPIRRAVGLHPSRPIPDLWRQPMTPDEFIRRKGYDPRVIPQGEKGPALVSHFPVQIPPRFEPSDIDGDGEDRRWDRKLCPGQDPEDSYRPRWGGGFFQPRGKHLHAAVDIMAAEGAYVVAPTSGTVPREVTVGRARRPGAGTSKKGGHYLFLVDAHGWEYYFSHLRDEPKVRPGDVVTAGELVGYVGRSGNASRKYSDGSIRGCPHLHLRVGKQLYRPGLARKYDAKALIRPLYDAGGWRAVRGCT